MIEIKSYQANLSTVSNQGHFQGYASSYATDHEKDKIMPGAFQNSLKNWQNKKKLPPLLWHHHTDQPIGFWKAIQENTKGLWVEGQLILDLTKGREIYILMKEGIVDSLSIGFKSIVSKSNPVEKCRKIFQLDLWEISIVTIPANPEAKITHIKQPSHL